MSDPGATFAAQLQALTQGFHRRLRQEALAFAELDSALTHCEDAQRRHCLTDLRDLAHRLHGAAASFALQDVSDAAALLENRAGELATQSQELDRSSLDAIHTALQSLVAVLRQPRA